MAIIQPDDRGFDRDSMPGGASASPPSPGPDNVDQPFDAAGQSLADALRASFRILKGIMLVLIVLYLFSNVDSIGGHEQALVLRFGRLLPKVHEPGLVTALPFPIDEIVPLPTRQSKELSVESHFLRRHEDELGKPLSYIHRSTSEGLHPSLDGALLTADAGLVHVQWKITYKIDDLVSYVTTLAGQKVEAAERLLKTLVETVGIHVASELTAEEVVRTRIDYVRSEMKRRLNLRLLELKSGINVTLVEMYEPTPPVQIREVFDGTISAENFKQRKIREAEQERAKILNEAAGAAHVRLVGLLEEIDQGGTAGRLLPELQRELDRMLHEDVEGKAGKVIKDAGAYYAVAVGRIQSDVGLYERLLPEYKRNSALLINREWERTRKAIFENSGVTKIYRPRGIREFRIRIPLDPEQARIEEEQRLQKKDFDPRELLPKEYVPVGPEFD